MTAGVLSILLAGLVLAIPGLATVGHRVAHAYWGWIVLGAGLELASCVGYVLAFQGIFKEVPTRFAALVATAEQAFGAVVPVGGAGGIAAGGWLLSRAGIPLRAIAKRSAVLFLLTSATNVATLVLAGAGLAIGIFAGPRDLLLSGVPAGVGLAVLILFLGLARHASHRSGAGSSRWSRVLAATAGASATTLQAIRRPGWRLAIGALAFLLCDIAVLWLAVHALGYDVPAAPLLLAYLIGYLANAIPIPGGIGVLDGGLAGALVLYHVPAPAALGGVLLYHALALWIPTLSGTVAFIAAQRQINTGAITSRPAHAPGDSGLATSVKDDGPGRCATRERRPPSAIHQACSPRFSECG
ncbi:MAG TPA: lysylphosphatidylglycerol synthase transmembrane domain-containing protein [Solirubrobacteraceae bacterium]